VNNIDFSRQNRVWVVLQEMQKMGEMVYGRGQEKEIF
jgi:hypothetical protein